MAYVKQNWVANVTVVSAAAMLHIEDGIYNAATVADYWTKTGGDVATTSRVLIDGNLAVKNGQASQLYMGDVIGGGQPGLLFGSAGDTSLYRSTGYTLRVSELLEVNQSLTIGVLNNAILNLKHNTARIYFGAAADNSLYRLGPQSLQTDGALGVRGLVSNGNAPSAWAYWSNVDADVNPRFVLSVNGQMQWGPGTTAADTSLVRAGVNQLQTSALLYVTNQIWASNGILTWGSNAYSRYNEATEVMTGDVGGAAGIYFGSAHDVKLYRAAAGQLKTDTAFLTGSWLAAQAGANQVVIGEVSAFVGGVARPGVVFGSGNDVSLSRSVAGLLSVAGAFSAGDVSTPLGSTIGGVSTYSAGNNWLSGYWGSNLRYDATAATWKSGNFGGNNGWGMIAVNGAGGGLDVYTEPATGAADRTYTPAQMMAKRVLNISPTGGLSWGASGTLDANLYRLASGILRTDGEFRAGTLNVTADGGKVYFGPSYDTALYRSAASVLKTDGHFRLSGFLDVDNADAGGKIRFGSLFDTNLYRSAADNIKTDNNLRVAKALVIDTADGGNRMYFGSALDTTIYRKSAFNLKTDGGFYVQKSLVIDDEGAGNRLYLGGAIDTSFYRAASNQIKTDGFLLAGALGTGGINGSAVGGTNIAKFPIYDAAGTLVGFVPIYSA